MPEIGQSISHYKIVKKIGQGGMGEVFLAEDTSLDRKVALKFLPQDMQQDDVAHQRFLREAKSAAALDHPYICNVHEVGSSEGRHFIAMEYVEGWTLKERLEEGALTLEEAASIAAQIANALEMAHQKGIVHRDLKPANIMLTSQGHAKVMDFGLAKRVVTDGGTEQDLTTGLTQEGSTLGTPAYMSPEQVRARPADHRSDIFAFGIIFYEMLTGVHPFRRAMPVETTGAILHEEPEPVAQYVTGATEHLHELVSEMLAKDPDQRIQTIGEVANRLAEFSAGGTEIGLRILVSSRLGRRLTLALIIIAVATLVGWWVFQRGPVETEAPGIHSIAVLPLENLSGDSGQDYFATGMTETLITDLARLGGLKRVIARRSVMRYQGTRRPLVEIAHELDVDALVTGSVVRSGGLVSIAVQLIDPLTEGQLWANRYERELKDIIRLQSDIVSAIVDELKVQLTPGEKASLASAQAMNPQAYEAYLKGRIESNRLSRKNLEMAMEYFRLALQKDPGFALAHVGIARLWGIRGHLGYVPPREAIPEVRAAVSQALALDEGLAEAYRVLGGTQFYLEWNWDGARRSWQRAEELGNRDLEGMASWAAYSAAMGQLEGTSAAFEQALESDPYNPQLRDFYGHQLLRLRRYDEAVAQFQRVLTAEPAFASSLNGLWRAFHFKQMYRDASGQAAQYMASSGYPEVAGTIEQDHEALEYEAAMRNAASALAERSGQSLLIARMFAFAGERDLAQHWLDRAYRDGDSSMVYLKVDPSFDILRDDPSFRTLLRKMNFPP